MLRNQGAQLHPSGLWRFYRRAAPQRHRLLFRAFTLGDALRPAEWHDLIGRDELAEWRRRGLLETQGTDFRAAFRIVVLDGLILLTDPFAFQDRFTMRVHVGRDTIELLEHIRERCPRGARHLDVGTGSGALLLAAGRTFAERVGIDINPRAIDVARFNAMLAGRRSDFWEADVFEAFETFGRFDLVTWNLPYQFVPPEDRARNVDGDGGAHGIELTLRFIELLPTLLTSSGEAYLMTSSPVLSDGAELLRRGLEDRRSLGLDVDIVVLHAQWARAWRQFHRAHGIKRIDNVVLRVRPGSGKVTRTGPGPLQKAVDSIQQVRHSF